MGSVHGSGASGGAKRRCPVGGAAYGMPLNTWTVVPSYVWSSPMTGPWVVSTGGVRLPSTTTVSKRITNENTTNMIPAVISVAKSLQNTVNCRMPRRLTQRQRAASAKRLNYVALVQKMSCTCMSVTCKTWNLFGLGGSAIYKLCEAGEHEEQDA